MNFSMNFSGNFSGENALDVLKIFWSFFGPFFWGAVAGALSGTKCFLCLLDFWRVMKAGIRYELLEVDGCRVSRLGLWLERALRWRAELCWMDFWGWVYFWEGDFGSVVRELRKLSLVLIEVFWILDISSTNGSGWVLVWEV